MRIVLHIGMEQVGADRLQQVLDAKRDGLTSKRVLYPRSPGAKNHTRLFMAVTDPDHIDPLRFNRGYITPQSQADLLAQVAAGLKREVEAHAPDLMILSASQLGSSLARPSELERLKALLSPISGDIRILAHIDEPGRLLARHYAAQVMEGRAAPLDLEFELAGSDHWWDDALLDAHQIDPQAGQFLETQAPPFWLDYQRLVSHWESVFGQGSVTLRPYDEARFHGPGVVEELRDAFGIEAKLGRAEASAPPVQPSAAWVARARQLNELLLKVLGSRKRILPRPLWRSFLGELEIAGDPIAPGGLADISKAFAPQIKPLLKAHPALTAGLPQTRPRHQHLVRGRSRQRLPRLAIPAQFHVAHRQGHKAGEARPRWPPCRR